MQGGAQEPDYLTGCSFNVNPATVKVAPNNPGAFQVTVNTSATPVASSISPPRASPPESGLREGTWAIVLVMLLLAALKDGPGRSTRIRVVQAVAMLIAGGLMVSACGGGGGAGTGDPPPTQAGVYQYTVVVTATVSSMGQPNVQSQFDIPLVVDVN